MPSTTDERVASFVNILTKASQKRRRQLHRETEKEDEALQHLKAHTIYCLDTLVQKQASLQTALTVLARSVWPELVQAIKQSPPGKNKSSTATSQQSIKARPISSAQVPKVLEHVFSQLLRLHDGLILLVSGECRHQGDIQALKPFATRLTQNATRADGYTQLYKTTSVYSGASNDEWFDRNNGLQKAWQDHLGIRTWERLLDKHTLIEAFLTDIETKLQQLQQEFSAVSTRVVQDLQRLFPQGQVKLSLQDQMERLHVDPWTWERRGKSFQWKHALGILPLGWTAQQWHKSLQWQSATQPTTLPATAPNDTAAPKKRRRVIQDDDGEEDKVSTKKKPVPTVSKLKKVTAEKAKENTSPPTMAEGLKVRTKTSKPTKTSSSTHYEASLDAIKAQLGVDVQALEKSRQELEQEEAGTAAQAQTVDDSLHTDPNHDNEKRERLASVRRVQVLSKQLRKMVHRQTNNDDTYYDVWDARECLRHALMEAGNLHLWANVKHDDDDERQRDEHGKKIALDFFVRSYQLVQDQKELHHRMVQESRATEELKMCWRSLLHLEAQALVNQGIARVELGQRTALVEALPFFETAEQSCHTLRQTAEVDQSNGDSILETTLDVIHADETAALSIRWKAECLWKLGRKAEAIASFSRAGNYHDQYLGRSLPLKEDQEVLQAFLLSLAESYNSWVRLIDLLSLDVQKTLSTSQPPEKWTKVREHLQMAFAGAVAISLAMHREGQRLSHRILQSLLSSRDVLGTDDLLQAEESLLASLTDRYEASRKPLSAGNTITEPLRRSDVAGAIATQVSSRWLITENEGSRRRHSRKRYGAGYSNIRVPQIEEQACAAAAASGSTSKQQFRKWGDDLFPKKRDEHGNLVPDFPFPFCAPQMPDAIRAVLQGNGTLKG